MREEIYRIIKKTKTTTILVTHEIKDALNIMEKLSYNAHDNENKNMGVLYILSALTLVSEPARDAMPWLYASVYHN